MALRSTLLWLLWCCPCFWNVTSVGEAWCGGAVTGLEQRDFTDLGETLFPLKQGGLESLDFLDNIFHAFFCDYFTRGFLRIWRPVPWKSGKGIEDIRGNRETLEAACSGMLDSRKCLKPRISHTQRSHVLRKMENWMPNDANRSMFTSPRLLSSCSPK